MDREHVRGAADGSFWSSSLLHNDRSTTRAKAPSAVAPDHRRRS